MENEIFTNEASVLTEDTVAETVAAEAPVAEEPKKKKSKKKLIIALVAVLLAGILAIGTVIVGIAAVVGGIFIFGNDSGSGSSSSSVDSYIPLENSYVRAVKNTKHSEYGITYGNAFEEFFSDTSWRHFVSTEGENVVEFEGDFYYSGSPATACIQFIVYDDSFTVYYLSINDVDQNKLMLSALIEKVFETYYD